MSKIREWVDCERLAGTVDDARRLPEKFPTQLSMALSVLFSENGLPNLPIILIEPHQNQRGVVQIRFCYADNEPLSIDLVQASALARNLRQLGEVELADEIDDALRANP